MLATVFPDSLWGARIVHGISSFLHQQRRSLTSEEAGRLVSGHALEFKFLENDETMASARMPNLLDLQDNRVEAP